MRVAEVMRAEAGLDLSQCRTLGIRNALTTLAADLGLAGPDEVIDAMDGPQHKRIVERLLSSLLVHETFFYRYRAQLDFLAERVLPAMLACSPPVLRLWSAGCASGPEAYTLAMLALHAIEQQGASTRLEVLGTDVAPAALAAAHNAVYPASTVADLPPTLRDRFLEDAGPGTLRVCERVMRFVRFRVHNLCERPPSGPFHLVSCRNVLMYLHEDAARRAAASLVSTLAPDGLLAVGHGESLRSLDHLLVPDRDSSVNLYRPVRRALLPAPRAKSRPLPEQGVPAAVPAAPVEAPTTRIVLRGTYDERDAPDSLVSLKVLLADAVSRGLPVVIEADGAHRLDGATARLIVRAARAAPGSVVVRATRQSVSEWARRYGVPLAE
jgi:chemotaxis methyl-accepting protein methylase